jgi:hypothetical protein
VSGSSGYLVRFTSATAIGNSSVAFDNGTNIGIGTTSPSSILHLYKADPNFRIQTNGGSNSAITLDDGSSYGYLIKNVSAGTANGALAGALYTYTDSGKAFQHIHSGTPLFTILSGGNVGIGTTNPAYILDVRGNVGSEPYSQAFFRNTNTSTAFGGIIVNGDNQSHIRFLTGASTWGGAGAKQWQIRTGIAANIDALAIYSWTLGADALYINSAGNVGISTTSPSGKLHVVGEAITFKNGSDSQTTHLYLANAANTRAYNLQLNSAGTNLALWGYNSSNAWQNLVNFNYN